MEGGGATLAMWAKGAGAPTIRSINTGGSQPYPVALNSDGKMGVLWNGKATTTSSGVMGVAVDSNGAPVLASGRTDLTQESLSSAWNGNPRATEIDAHAFSGGLAVAGSVVGAFQAATRSAMCWCWPITPSARTRCRRKSRRCRFTLPGRALLGTGRCSAR
jgi:hypothetical protein